VSVHIERHNVAVEQWYLSKSNVKRKIVDYQTGNLVTGVVASVMIHSDAKRRLDVPSSLTGYRTSDRIAEGMWFQSYEGHLFLRSVTYDP
jgi:hypothetical protein